MAALHGKRGTIALASGLLATLIAATTLCGTGRVEAQSPPATSTPTPEVALSPPLAAQALRIEQQLLCPLCTNERLDVCENAICHDMRQHIEQRLIAGDSPDEIIQFFTKSYGERILAELPKRGFNLWLWAWVSGSALVVTALGASWLLAHRTRSRDTATSLPLSEVDEGWLDDELRADPTRRGN